MNKIEAVTVSTRQSWTGVLSLQKDSKKSKKKRSKPQIPAQVQSAMCRQCKCAHMWGACVYKHTHTNTHTHTLDIHL